MPVAVPLSWFYMGFASFVLADAIVAARGWRRRTLCSVLLGAWLLTAWDLVLDPSMAAPQMQYIHFWIWHESGAYFGMPPRNLVGWLGTGLLFIAAGRALWRESAPPPGPVRLPLTVYALNVVWSMVLSVSAGHVADGAGGDRALAGARRAGAAPSRAGPRPTSAPPRERGATAA